jgi:hypothetical protein
MEDVECFWRWTGARRRPWRTRSVPARWISCRHRSTALPRRPFSRWTDSIFQSVRQSVRRGRRWNATRVHARSVDPGAGAQRPGTPRRGDRVAGTVRHLVAWPEISSRRGARIHSCRASRGGDPAATRVEGSGWPRRVHPGARTFSHLRWSGRRCRDAPDALSQALAETTPPFFATSQRWPVSGCVPERPRDRSAAVWSYGR